MYKNKLTPEEALETIKLRMKYDSKFTLNENKSLVSEQGLTDNQNLAVQMGFGPVSAQYADQLAQQGKLGKEGTENLEKGDWGLFGGKDKKVAPEKPEGGAGLIGGTVQKVAPEKPEGGAGLIGGTRYKNTSEPSKPPASSASPAKPAAAPPPKPTLSIPGQLKNIDGVKNFQNWLDINFPNWHNKYGVLNQNVQRGFGKFGPRTSQWWKEKGNDYLNIRNTNRKNGERIVMSDGNTLVWDGRDKEWLKDTDWLKIYNYDGTYKAALPRTTINKIASEKTTPLITPKNIPTIQPQAPVVAKVATKEVDF